ncbi:actin binding protein [Phytophthora pseudosyringae]|uniref:Amine oxidase n=1 Tax=Phytophthora pseudosyringae TaxID=221518 RepID=A0A8T1VWY5_9STRA|nr:actin binding protein [Phytophthora pseudosyringae]
MLREPDHATLDEFKTGDAIPREIGTLLLNLDGNVAREMVADIPARKDVHERVLEPAVDGWSPIMDEDYVSPENILKAYPVFLNSLKMRGLSDMNQVRCLPLSAGVYDYGDEVGCRMIRVLSFLASENTHSMFAHPIDGIVAHVDLTNRRVARLIDTGYNTFRWTTLTANLKWEKWEIRVGFNGREGLTLHDVSFDDNGRKRPILNRASVSEMVVPYGRPEPTHDWQNYFDVGEYQFGRIANSLVLGCDCLGKIQYLDAVVVDDLGEPVVLKNVVCIHEEDYGTLWKHSDVYTSTGTVRRQRRLVLSFFVTVVNYDYGFYWYFYLDGRIELECKATGLVFTSGHPGGQYDFATEMAPRLGAPCHQHLFSARLDVAIDGGKCFVDELEVEQLPITTNRLGNPTAYVLAFEGQPLLLAAKESSVAKRAIFASKHLWVTQYARDELWAAGYTPNQNPGFAGLPAYTKANRSVNGENIVVWHTFGLTHFPRPEDWPIMPVDYAKFTFRPEGFFDRNPTLDMPEDPNGKEHSESCCP